jgi:NAD-dependent dihydropyrimidine dehydrogenase PreA subunit
MPTFVYMTRCDGCGHCVDICPSDIMHIDETYRRAYNIEPNMCWECYSCVKACPQNAIDVRGYADFAPLGHSVRVQRDEQHGKELPLAHHHQALGHGDSQAGGGSGTEPGDARQPAPVQRAEMDPHG